MGLPALWDEISLTGEMRDELEAVSADLNLDPTSLIERAVQKDVPEVLKVSSVDDVAYDGMDAVVKVLTIARWRAWERAYQKTLLNFRLKAGSAELYQSEAWEHMKEYLAEVRAAAMQYAEARVFVGSSGSRQAVPATGRLTTTAPVTPCWPPDGNDPRYSGTVY